MTQATAPAPAVNWQALSPGLPLLLGILAMYVPTYMALDEHLWGIVGQGHGPVMLALSLWLAWQRLPKLLALQTQPAPLWGTLSLLLGGAVYVLGRSQDILFLDVLSQVPILAGLLLLSRGWAGVRVMVFPLLFSLTCVPLPGSVVDMITGPLKIAVSTVAEQAMFLAGYPVGRSGVIMSIGPYQLMVADACAGMNSIFALEAIGIFYISMAEHTSRLRNTVLTLMVVPVSFISNVCRVIILSLVTYYFGDEAGQGFMHGFAGVLMFAMATAFIIGLDSLYGMAANALNSRRSRAA